MALFATRGMHGVTTRDLARAAGVSEALLYRHFDSKEALYAEIQRACLAQAQDIAARMARLTPSTTTLVLAIFFLTSTIVGAHSDAKRQEHTRRLIVFSLLDDGAFARGFLAANVERWLPVLISCMRAAHKSGDLVDTPTRARTRLWLTHHLAAALAWFQLPRGKVVDYGASAEGLLDEAVRFSLRGLGLTPKAIGKHYDPKKLRRVQENIAQGAR